MNIRRLAKYRDSDLIIFELYNECESEFTVVNVEVIGHRINLKKTGIPIKHKNYFSFDSDFLILD